MKIITWNLNSRTNLETLNKQCDYLKEQDLDLITLQEVTLNSQEFFNIPVSIIVKRRSNNQPVDQLHIENIAMDREGANIWLECFVNDEQMIEKEPKVKKHLEDSEKKFEKLSLQLKQKRQI